MKTSSSRGVSVYIWWYIRLQCGAHWGCGLVVVGNVGGSVVRDDTGDEGCGHVEVT